MSIEFKAKRYVTAYEAAQIKYDNATAQLREVKAEYNKACMELSEALNELRELLTAEEWEEYKKEHPQYFPKSDSIIELMHK